MEAARDIFYGIYGDGGRSVIIDNLLQRLDFHALSVTLLATTVLSASAWAAQDAATANHAADMEKGTALFNSDVAALLNEHCVKCHGGEKGSKGALDLTTRELALKGGDTGPAFVPGKSADSLLVQSIRHEDKELQMPKKADKLPDEVIAEATVFPGYATWIFALVGRAA